MPLVALIGGALPLQAAASGSESVPTQYITKLYTEALGRAPDQASWSAVTGTFASGCTVEQLKSFGRSVYTSSEYAGLGYSHAAKLITLYRGALNREPDSGGFDVFHQQLNTGTPWSSVVESILTSGEFASRVSSFCSASYGWYATPVLTVPTAGTADFAGGSGAALQALLNSKSQSGGGLVTLSKRAVVRLTTTLTLPGNVTLLTVEAPTPRQYAEMGRLVRAAGFNAPLVSIEPGGALKHVWVDGRRSEFGYIIPSTGIRDAQGYNVLALCNVTFSQNRLGDAAGWTNLYVAGASYPSSACQGDSPSVISQNLVTAYASPDNSYTQDGFSVAHHNAQITHNVMVDLTDVYIVLFRGEAGRVQHSRVANNTLFSGGNAAGGGIVIDPLPAPSPAQRVRFSFVGTRVENNTIWTSARGYIKIALSVGTRAWFGDYACYGDGAVVQYNGTGSSALVTNSNIHIAAGGLSAPTTIEGNAFYGTPFARPPTIDPRTCPVAGTAKENNPAYSPATLQGGSFAVVTFPSDGCVVPFAWPPPW
ncbi:DUF4214 domain-containing protein [Hyalangium sp.]|uniref:DUF4214 domain-containing protein n=1 Tax=Hyalangium sp. TaxID=2028555 RepID=UPI002D6F12F5|nr:DUF4214 domain-containing protein [Hyalangium sp.]HYH99332.1 DUF4214 domain-containing protein [Hyalangium sp.]